MKYSELKERITVIIESLPTPGSFHAVVTGFLPNDELINFELSIEGCQTQEILNATINASLEDLLNARYDYIEGPIDETLLYDGGTFNESDR